MSMDRVFKALADQSRRRLLDLLHLENGRTLGELCEHLSMSRQAVTKHLEALADAGLVTSEKDGRERIWTLETRRLAEAQRYLDEISSQWDSAIERLRAFVETDD